MRLVRVTIGIDWKNTKNYNSDRHSISLSADLESSDALEDVERRLHNECRAYLQKVSANGREEGVSVKKEVKEETPPAHAPAPVFEKEQEETKAAVETEPAESSDPKDEDGYAQSIIDGHKIRSLAHAGWLRSQKQITYPEWKVVHQYLSEEQIAEAEA